MRVYRPILAINEETGERKEYSGVYAAAKDLGTTGTSVVISIAMATAVKGWKVYDTPDRIRERIKELEKQLEMLEGYGNL